jgi:hypothetical protein
LLLINRLDAKLPLASIQECAPGRLFGNSFKSTLAQSLISGMEIVLQMLHQKLFFVMPALSNFSSVCWATRAPMQQQAHPLPPPAPEIDLLIVSEFRPAFEDFCAK